MQQGRYMIAYGIMIAKDGYEIIIEKSRAAEIKVEGMYIYEINEPGKPVCLLFSCMTPIFSSKDAVCRFTTNSISRAESFVLAMLMSRLDPERKLLLRCSCFFVDTTEARVRIIRAPSSEETEQVKLRYARARVGDSPEEIRESREIRRVARLGTTENPKIPDDAKHDPEDRSGISAEIELLERAEQRYYARKAEKSQKPLTTWNPIGIWRKRIRERNQQRSLRPPKAPGRCAGMPHRQRRSQGPPPGTKDFRPILQPATQTQLTEPPKRRQPSLHDTDSKSLRPSACKIPKIDEQKLYPQSDDEIISDEDLFGDVAGADEGYCSPSRDYDGGGGGGDDDD